MRFFSIMMIAAILVACGATQVNHEQPTVVESVNPDNFPETVRVLDEIDLDPSLCKRADIYLAIKEIYLASSKEQVRRLQAECGMTADGVVDTRTRECIVAMAEAVRAARLVSGMCATEDGGSDHSSQRVEAERLAAMLREFLAQGTPPPDPMPELQPLPEIALGAWTGYVLIDLEQAPPKMVALITDGVITQDTLKDGIVLQPEPIPEKGGWCFTVPGSVIFRSICSSENGVWGTIAFDEGDAAGHVFNVYVRRFGTMLNPCSKGVCGNLYKLVADNIVGCSGPRCREFFERRNPAFPTKQL